MPGGTNATPQLDQIILNTSQTRFEVFVFVLVIVAAQDIEVVSGAVDDCLAPIHVVGAFLSAGDNSGARGDLSEPAAIYVDDLGVPLRAEAEIHRFVVDLEILHAVWIGVAVGCALL